MSLWLPRSPPLALIAVVRRSYGTRSRLVPNLHARRALPVPQQFIQAHPPSRFESTKTTVDPSSPSPSPPAAKTAKPADPILPRVWKKIKHEAQHYWQGSKLLAKEVRISARLQRKILQGETLTRRERRQVCSSDLTSLSADYNGGMLSFDGRHKTCFE
jgi:LETM1 and EF-hand domain-containing protein 1, mitochondrial